MPTAFLSVQPSSWSGPVLVGAFLGYAALCSIFRFRRINALQSRLGFHDRKSLGRMTNEEAHQIVRNIANFEFPLFYDLSVRLALFEVCSSQCRGSCALLTLGRHMLFSQLRSCFMLYADTEVVYCCFASYSPASPGLHKAVARMNYLHAPYIKAGKILQEDLLYVLYASMAEPVRFLRLYEWRELTDMEVAALGTMWKYVADMMEIDYKTVLKKDMWVDGLEFFEDVSRWGEIYEDEHLRPSKEINELGHLLMNMLLQSHAKVARPLGYPAACVLMGPRLRRAFGFPEPGLGITVLTYSLLLARKLTVRYLCLPRFTPCLYISQPDEQTGRISAYHYMKEPWYVASTFWSRWNPEALFTRLAGGLLPGDGGADIKPEGFLPEDLGPERFVGKGVEEGKVMEQEVKKKISLGCPFSAAAKA
ncbi:MPAB-Lcp-cat domain-containing protein [Fusarium keratoplasticum]|nr:MPAB-Lcp-cat domain-containing protein [Fusarium keratoplasticum]